jgi:hypothetical protein
MEAWSKEETEMETKGRYGGVKKTGYGNLGGEGGDVGVEEGVLRWNKQGENGEGRGEGVEGTEMMEKLEVDEGGD